jgi:hypothetical protein
MLGHLKKLICPRRPIFWPFQEWKPHNVHTKILINYDFAFAVQVPTTNHLSMIYMSQMILSEPSLIIIWTYQDMMEWMSRILVGETANGWC